MRHSSTSPPACITPGSIRSPGRKSTSAPPARPQAAAGADAVLQAGELLHGARGVAQGGAGRPDRQRVRLPDPGPAAEGGDRSEQAPGERTAEGDHYHTVANPAKGEPVGERGLPNQGYRPGRKTARRQDKKPSGTAANQVATVVNVRTRTEDEPEFNQDNGNHESRKLKQHSRNCGWQSTE